MEILREFKWCERYNMDYIKVSLNKNSLTIWDSYKVKKHKHMKEVIKWIESFDKKYLFNKPVWLHIAEWKVYNLLYALGYEQNRTRYTDLDDKQDIIHKIGYTILSLFYWGF